MVIYGAYFNWNIVLVIIFQCTTRKNKSHIALLYKIGFHSLFEVSFMFEKVPPKLNDHNR